VLTLRSRLSRKLLSITDHGALIIRAVQDAFFDQVVHYLVRKAEIFS
jgi:hypothetical protein